MKAGAAAPLEVSGRIPIDRTGGFKLTIGIVGLCAAPEPNCFLVADFITNAVVRLSLATQCIEQCVTRVPFEDGRVSAVQLLQMPPSGAARIALLLYKKSETAGDIQYRHIARLLAHQSNGWRVAHDTEFDTTSYSLISSGMCVSRGFLLCAALHYSRRLAALKVTSDSQLRPAGAFAFDSQIRGLCAFASGDEQLVATTHFDCTVRMWRHQLQAAASTDFALDECCRVTADSDVNRIISADAGLLVASWLKGPMRLCRVNGRRIDAPVPQPQLGNAFINCWCRAQDAIVAYDYSSVSFLTLSAQNQK